MWRIAGARADLHLSRKIRCIRSWRVLVARINIVLDDELIKRAMQVSGAKTKREAVDRALRELVARGPVYRAPSSRARCWDGDVDGDASAGDRRPAGPHRSVAGIPYRSRLPAGTRPAAWAPDPHAGRRRARRRRSSLSPAPEQRHHRARHDRLRHCPDVHSGRRRAAHHGPGLRRYRTTCTPASVSGLRHGGHRAQRGGRRLAPQLEALVPDGVGAGAHGGHAHVEKVRLAGPHRVSPTA